MGVINMYCSSCGNQLTENDKFCHQCGAVTDAPAQQQSYAPAPPPQPYAPPAQSQAYAQVQQYTQGPEQFSQAMPADPREKLEKKFSISRNNLLAVIAFTAINIVLVLTNSDWYFLFSASIPIFVLFLGSEFINFAGDISFAAQGIAASFISLSIYGIIWGITKKHKAWIIAALVYFSIDIFLSLYLLVTVIDEFEAVTIVELAFRGLIMFYLISGTITWAKLRKLESKAVATESVYTQY